MTRWAKINALINCLIKLCCCKEGNTLNAESTTDITSERYRRCGYIIRQIHNDVEVVFPEGEIESFQRTANAPQGLLGSLDSFGTTLLHQPFIALWCVLSVK